MHLISVLQAHPLSERLTALSERLQGQREGIAALKRKIVDRLLACQQSINAMKLDANGTYVTTGVRERLQALVPGLIEGAIEIDAHGWVNLHEGEERLQLGTIALPVTDPLARQDFLNRNCLKEVERMTFSRTDCFQYTNPNLATLDGVGNFQFTEEDAVAARVAIGIACVRSYVGVARTIHDDEEESSYRDDRVGLNLQDAFGAVEWLEAQNLT